MVTSWPLNAPGANSRRRVPNCNPTEGRYGARMPLMTRGPGLLTLVVLVAIAVSGCATHAQHNLQENIRKASHQRPVSEAPATAPIPALFGELGRAAGIDPSTIYLALQNDASPNAASVGNHHFLITRGAASVGDQ